MEGSASMEWAYPPQIPGGASSLPFGHALCPQGQGLESKVDRSVLWSQMKLRYQSSTVSVLPEWTQAVNCDAECAIISEPMNRILDQFISQDDGMDLSPVAVPVDGDARGL